MDDTSRESWSDMTNAWFDAAKISIRLVENGEVLKDPAIVCTQCGVCLTILADMDTVAALMTLSAEHSCLEMQMALEETTIVEGR